MPTIRIKTEYITLGQFIKFIGLISSGFEAKGFLASNSVKINGVIDTRRGRKLRPNDLVDINNKQYMIKKE